ncbi:MAG: DUF2946 domain-containing protein [Halomonadaceae bacterium]|uniref:DUF2946 domain-containing protein n=1 Tax=Halomonas colorata TaxID=2742615 RepID=A0ABR9G171_9GAMM|nr:DUF2946 domain-containing protein [Halomonas colorata]MBE0464650.1 DUF2946 domain-containing protein [Halomonas colorata]
MALSRSARLLYYRFTLAMAWVAMCLLFAGPLISQLQASHNAHGHHGHTHIQHAHSHGHPASDEHYGHSADEHAGHPVAHQAERPLVKAIGLSPSNALSDWHNQCGYCELWQHSPSLSIALPAIASGAFLALGSEFLAPKAGALFQYNYPHALTRGPPSFIYGCLKHYTRAVLIVTRNSKKEIGLLSFFKA